jgi:hypothetical protein
MHRNFQRVQVDGIATIKVTLLDIIGIVAIFSNDYVKSENFPTAWRYGGQPAERQTNVRTYLFDAVTDQGMFEAYRDKLRGQESIRTRFGSASTSEEWRRAIGNDIGLSLRDETTLEDFPKGFILIGRNKATDEMVAVLYHHIFLRPWLFWEHFLEGEMLPTVGRD